MIYLSKYYYYLYNIGNEMLNVNFAIKAIKIAKV